MGLTSVERDLKSTVAFGDGHISDSTIVIIYIYIIISDDDMICVMICIMIYDHM